MQLHDYTILFLLAVIASVNGVVLGWGSLLSGKMRAPWFWSAASLTLALAAGAALWSPDAWRPILFNLPLTLSHGLWLAGTLRFCGRPPRDGIVFGVVLLVALCTVSLTLLYPDRNLRIFLAASATALLRLTTGVVLWRCCQDHDRWVARTTAAVIATESLILFDHAFAALHGGVPGIGNDPQSLRQMTWFGLLLTAVVTTPLLMLLGLSRLLGELRESAHQDGLTGLPNRRGFFAQIGPLLAHGQRGERRTAVLMLDVDHFKQINDRHGHTAGDSVLHEMGATLREILRRSDVPVRWGGEEFCVLLPDTDGAGAGILAQRIRQRFSERCRSIQALAKQRVSVSIGIAYGLLKQHPFEILQQQADAALYAAKDAGRDRAVAAADVD